MSTNPSVPAAIAIVGPSILKTHGLKSILEKVMPVVEIAVFASHDELGISPEAFFSHFFVFPEVLCEAPAFYMGHIHQTIVVVDDEESARNVPMDFLSVCVGGTVVGFVRQLMTLFARAHRDYAHLPKLVAQQMKRKVGAEKRAFVLTAREEEVVKAIVEGLSNKQIADRLCVSLSTVNSHRRNVMEKLGTHSAAQLVVMAMRHGIVPMSADERKG